LDEVEDYINRGGQIFMRCFTMTCLSRTCIFNEWSASGSRGCTGRQHTSALS